MIRFGAIVRREVGHAAAAFLLGLIGGHSLATTLSAARVDRLMLREAAQSEQIERLENEVERLEASLSERRQRPLQKLEIEVPSLKEERLRLRIEGIVYDLLEHLVGTEMDRIDPETVQKLAERTVSVDDVDFDVRVLRLVAWESTLSLTLEVRPR